ncbi:ABC transporter ATP-binding protein [Pirellulaceae bacterium SH501]
MQKNYLECWRLRKEFKTERGPFVAVRDFTLNMREGEFVSIIGHSGCGKSTVLSMIAGLHKLNGGGIVLDHREVYDAGPDRAVVFQSPHLLPWLTALENVTLGLEQVEPRKRRSELAEIAAEWLKRVGLSASLQKKPSELSQGMQQRVGIARAFALKPKMLLLDEPFGMLDSLTRFELQDVLLDVWSRYQITTMMVTHDVDEAVLLSDRIVMMTNGPDATIGDIATITLPRPRHRETVLESADFLSHRAHVIEFLEHPILKAA